MRKWRTVLVGLGRIGMMDADDPLVSRHYRYASHAQVLAEHASFLWEAAVDPSAECLQVARDRWRVRIAVRSVAELRELCAPEIAVIATPPRDRRAIVEALPDLRGVLVEKPLGETLREAEDFVAYCTRRGIRVQVNLWRRADEVFRELATGRLQELVGRPQAVFGVYGNGLLNNGTHMIDFVRMLCGEIRSVQAVGGVAPYRAGPIAKDVNIPFTVVLQDGTVVMLQPVRFEHYRENGLDIWGDRARLAIVQEGLRILLYPQREHRAVPGEREIESEHPRALPSTVGSALYHVYSNLADALAGETPL